MSSSPGFCRTCLKSTGKIDATTSVRAICLSTSGLHPPLERQRADEQTTQALAERQRTDEQAAQAVAKRQRAEREAAASKVKDDEIARVLRENTAKDDEIARLRAMLEQRSQE